MLCIHTFAFDWKNIIINANIFVSFFQSDHAAQDARIRRSCRHGKLSSLIKCLREYEKWRHFRWTSPWIANYPDALAMNFSPNARQKKKFSINFHFPECVQFSHHLITFDRRWWIYRCIKKSRRVLLIFRIFEADARVDCGESLKVTTLFA